MGNSAMDIAVELSRVASSVYLAARRGAHIVPKFAFGRPIDTYDQDLPLPWPVKRAIFGQLVRRSIGTAEAAGMPKPDHRLGEAHPTVSQHILDRVRAGAVVPKPNIAELRGGRVAFVDGSEVEADVVVYCTGYNISFPFLDDSVISVRDNRVDLFLRVFPPGTPSRSSGCCSPSVPCTRCRKPRPTGWATTSPVPTSCRRETRCWPRFERTMRRSSAASSPPRATPSKSTTTATCGRSRDQARRSAPGQRSVARLIQDLHPHLLRLRQLGSGLVADDEVVRLLAHAGTDGPAAVADLRLDR